MIKCGQINGARMLVIFTRGRFGFVSSLLIRFIVMSFSCAFSTFKKKKKKFTRALPWLLPLAFICLAPGKEVCEALYNLRGGKSLSVILHIVSLCTYCQQERRPYQLQYKEMLYVLAKEIPSYPLCSALGFCF